jgi:hypothetical protein
VKALRDEGFEVTGLFLNPNIHPLREYLRRKGALLEVSEKLDFPVIYKDEEYEPQEYFRRVAYREANRCFHCYSMRLERAHSIAGRGGFEAFTSTLLYSRRQKHEMIAQLCRDLAGGGAPEFLYRDFRQGWKQGVEESKAMGVYRQQYCGCLFSEAERYRRELES